MSRRDGDEPLLAPLLEASLVPAFSLYDELRQELTSNDELRVRRDAVAAGDHGDTWSIRDGLIIYKGHVFVPSASVVLPDVL